GGTRAGAAGGTGAAGSGGARTGGTGATGAGGAAGLGAGGTRAGAAGVTGAAGPRGARTGGTGGLGAGGDAGVGAGDTGAGGAGPGGAGAVGAGSGDIGRLRVYFVPLLQQVLVLSSFTGLIPPLLCPPPELVDFAAACRLDYAASLVAESESGCPPSVSSECAFGTDVLEYRQEDFECFAAAIAMDVEMASWKSTGTYVDAVPPPGANIVDGILIFRVKRPTGSPPAFKARYVARGFSQRQGVDFFQTFSPTPKMTTLRVLLHIATQRDYELHSLDFSTAFLQGSLRGDLAAPPTWLHWVVSCRYPVQPPPASLRSPPGAS
ncbi:unnamed protein product, partial [Closterium sp. NIES-53]